jgi:hypothetical protein
MFRRRLWRQRPPARPPPSAGASRLAPGDRSASTQSRANSVAKNVKSDKCEKRQNSRGNDLGRQTLAAEGSAPYGVNYVVKNIVGDK